MRRTAGLRALARADQALPVALRFPDSLLQRVRWLFLAFALLLDALWLVYAPWYPGAVPAARLAAAGALLVIAGWGVGRYLGRFGGFLPDLAPPVALAVIALVLQADVFVVPLAFGWMLFHSLYGGVALTAFKVVHYVIAVELGVIVAGEPVLGLAPRTITNVLVFVVIAAVMQVLKTSLERSALQSRRERVLADAGRRLLSARRSADIDAATAAAAWELLDDEDAIVSLWRRDDDDFTPVRVEAAELEPELPSIPASAFAESARSRLRRGEPYVVGVDTSQRLAQQHGFDYTGQTVVIVPLSIQGTVMGALVLAATVRVDHDLLAVLRRFGIEISLALERAEAMERLGDYAHELQAANREMRRASRVKDEFLSSVTHELRTPLTAIAGFASTLLRRWDSLASDDAQRFVAIIERHALRQRRLVDDLLTVTRLEAQAVEPRRVVVDLRDLALDVVAEVASSVGAVTVTAPGAPTAWADPDHLARILINLLTNAEKYGAPPIAVEIPPALPDEPAEIRVVDHGPGIDEGFLPRLFSRFEQASSGDDRQSSGVGLGLAIARELARRNRGDLVYEPTPGGGATFVVTVPNARAAERDAAEGEPANGGVGAPVHDSAAGARRAP